MSFQHKQAPFYSQETKEEEQEEEDVHQLRHRGGFMAVQRINNYNNVFKQWNVFRPSIFFL